MPYLKYHMSIINYSLMFCEIMVFEKRNGLMRNE